MKIEFISNTFKQSKRKGEYADSISVTPVILFYRDITDVDGEKYYKYSISLSFLVFEISLLFKEQSK